MQLAEWAASKRCGTLVNLLGPYEVGLRDIAPMMAPRYRKLKGGNCDNENYVESALNTWVCPGCRRIALRFPNSLLV